MKNILVVLTGGTICSEERAYNNGSKSCEEGLLVRAITESAGEGLISVFMSSASPFASEVSFDTSENFGILSENMTIEKWNVLLEYFRKLYQGRGEKSISHYDGILVAHGTDTLAYSTAIFSLLLKEIEAPIVFVSANGPLGKPSSNGHSNFRHAVEAICLGLEKGVFAVYKNPEDGRTLLHRGGLLTQAAEYSDNFHSKGEVDVSGLLPDGCSVSKDKYIKILSTLPEDPVRILSHAGAISTEEKPCEGLEISVLNDSFNLKNCVLQISPYPGLDYSALRVEGFKAILHKTYHSGTLCTAGEGTTSVLSLVDWCGNGPDLWFSPTKLNDGVYESVVSLSEYAERAGVKLNFSYGLTSELLYGWLVVEYSRYKHE